MDPLQDAVLEGVIIDIKNRCEKHIKNNKRFLLIVGYELYLELKNKHKNWMKENEYKIKSNVVVKGLVNYPLDYVFLVEEKEE